VTRATVNAGTWEPENRPAPVVYSVEAGGERVHLTVLHTDRHDGRQMCVHGMALTADEARALSRALFLAAAEL